MHTILNATRKDKAAVVNILSASFKHDPQTKWMIGDREDAMLDEKCIKQFMSYVFEYGFANGSIKLTEDKKAVAIWKDPRSNKMNSFLLVENLKFLIVFGIKTIRKISNMEQKIGAYYPKDKKFNYLWLLGTHPSAQGKGYGASLINTKPFHTEDDKPIYLETSTRKNVSYYVKQGFNVYREMVLDDSNKLIIFCLRK
jgi:ribosomal protein S18 acetylase RimI-like enzyme